MPSELLLTGQLDAALVCTGGYLELRRRALTRVEVLAVPRIGGKTTYQSVVIVPASSDATRLEGLRGRRFAYTDELSLSGHAYALYAIRQLHEDPLHFFSSTVFTNSHDRSIDAVANGLVDGASVDGLIFEYREDREPDIAEKTRVIHRSSPLGIMPIVAGPALAPEMHARLRDVLLRLHEDPEARAALSVIGIERFVTKTRKIYLTPVRPPRRTHSRRREPQIRESDRIYRGWRIPAQNRHLKPKHQTQARSLLLLPLPVPRAFALDPSPGLF